LLTIRRYPGNASGSRGLSSRLGRAIRPKIRVEDV
jgi:hypothetical protein